MTSDGPVPMPKKDKAWVYRRLIARHGYTPSQVASMSPAVQAMLLEADPDDGQESWLTSRLTSMLMTRLRRG